MEKLSDRCAQEALDMAEQVISIVEPACVILLSILVGLILLSVMMPLLGILSEMLV